MRKLSIRVYTHNFIARLRFSNNRLISFFIKYDDELILKGSDTFIKINGYSFKKKRLLQRFNRRINEGRKHKIREHKIEKMLFDLLTYIHKLARGKDRELIKKVEEEIRNKKLNVKVYPESKKRINRKIVFSVIIITLVFSASFTILFCPRVVPINLNTEAIPFIATVQMPRVTQTITGVLYNNGTAIISLYSTGNIDIVAASLSNTTVYASLIKNPHLKPGNNVIIINFGSVQIMPSVLYTISLYLNNGEITEVIVYSL